MTDIPTSPLIHKFQVLCGARARNYALGHERLQDAVDFCQNWAQGHGLLEGRDAIGQDAVQLIMAREFAAVRFDLGGWVP